jgi:hypothetical protein
MAGAWALRGGVSKLAVDGDRLDIRDDGDSAIDAGFMTVVLSASGIDTGFMTVVLSNN